MLVSNIFFFHREPWGNVPNLTVAHNFHMGVVVNNHQLERSFTFQRGFHAKNGPFRHQPRPSWNRVQVPLPPGEWLQVADKADDEAKRKRGSREWLHSPETNIVP